MSYSKSNAKKLALIITVTMAAALILGAIIRF